MEVLKDPERAMEAAHNLKDLGSLEECVCRWMRQVSLVGFYSISQFFELFCVRIALTAYDWRANNAISRKYCHMVRLRNNVCLIFICFRKYKKLTW